MVAWVCWLKKVSVVEKVSVVAVMKCLNLHDVIYERPLTGRPLNLADAGISFLDVFFANQQKLIVFYRSETTLRFKHLITLTSPSIISG